MKRVSEPKVDAASYQPMCTSPRHRARKLKVTRETLRVDLADGRTLIVPTYWYPRLLLATAKQRANYRLTGDGEGIHWPGVDEDLRVEGLLAGTPAPRGKVTRRATSRRNAKK